MATQVEELPADELRSRLVESFGNEGARLTVETVNRWLERGDGVAVYRNVALDHSALGQRKYVSFGSPAAQLETDEPPQRLPDIGGDINWPYQLEATYRGDRL